MIRDGGKRKKEKEIDRPLDQNRNDEHLATRDDAYVCFLL